jgi:RHS repeat-associated protein
LSLTGPGTSAYRYARRRYEPETGLYCNGARAYSPSLGRFLQTDPIGTQGGINLYACSANNPINWPRELCRCSMLGLLPSLGGSSRRLTSYHRDLQEDETRAQTFLDRLETNYPRTCCVDIVVLQRQGNLAQTNYIRIITFLKAKVATMIA